MPLGLWYHHGTNIAMVLSAKARRNLSQNKGLQQTLHIGNVCGPTIHFTIHFEK